MRFYSPGKLLLTGEYLVLNGATALAVPVRFGQWLEAFEEPGKGCLNWESFVMDTLWFSGRFGYPGFDILSCTDQAIAKRLVKLFKGIELLKPESFNTKTCYRFITNLEFDINWGLGSSSTLISNLASWAGIDPYDLMVTYSKGSGYDIACARSAGPLLYSRQTGKYPEIEYISFNPDFREHIFFVYSGKKQQSEESVLLYLDHINPGSEMIKHVSQLSRTMATVKTLPGFSSIVNEHENIISDLLGRDKIKDISFRDFQGEIKSLGAWGGDFIMASTTSGLEEVKHYFGTKGLTNVFTFDEMVLC